MNKEYEKLTRTELKKLDQEMKRQYGKSKVERILDSMTSAGAKPRSFNIITGPAGIKAFEDAVEKELMYDRDKMEDWLLENGAGEQFSLTSNKKTKKVTLRNIENGRTGSLYTFTVNSIAGLVKEGKFKVIRK